MSWTGWLSFGGTEILNGPRTAAYIHNQSPSVSVSDPCAGECTCEHLPGMLGDKPYTSPLVDDAPWVDLDRRESYRFFGAYPLDVRGLDDDSMDVSIVSGVGPGGWVTGLRRKTKEVYVEAALFSADDEADHYGISWLKAALEGSCEQGDCLPTDRLCFLTSCADTSDMNSVSKYIGFRSDEMAKFAHDGWYTRWGGGQLWFDRSDSGLTMTARKMCEEVDWDLTVQGTVGTVLRGWINDTEYVDWTLTGETQNLRVTTDEPKLRITVVEAPFGYPVVVTVMSAKAYGFQMVDEEDCVDDFMRYLRRVARTDGPYTTNIVHLSNGMVVRTVRFNLTAEIPFVYGEERPAGAVTQDEILYDPDYRIWRLSDQNVGECSEAGTRLRLIYDPDMPTIPPKPPPSLKPLRPSKYPLGDRPYAISIPDTQINEWMGMVPIMSIKAVDRNIRDIRVRFFPLPFDTTQIGDIDPCSACGAFEIAYLPEDYTIWLDGADERAYMGIRRPSRPADHLLRGDRGLGAMMWPVLTCGSGYLALIDTQDKKVELTISFAVRE